MAVTSMTFSRILKTLRENGNVDEKREALTYIASHAKKLEISGTIKEERYKEVCWLVIEVFMRHEGALQSEALGAFSAIVQEFRMHRLHLFESMIRTDKKTRLKIFKLMEILDDSAISAAANDEHILNFFKYCLSNVEPSLMEWLTPMACVDNLQVLTRIEHRTLSEEEKLEEDINIHALALLRRLYRLAAIMFDQSIQKYDLLLMDKVVTLAYMGHKRQRGPALKILQQVITTNLADHIRKDFPDVWTQYKTNLQSTYYKRMLLLVAACDLDWITQWNTTIQFLGTDLHDGANLINNLLSVEEKAFKSTDPVIRRQAFLSWRLLIDNFALNPQELATARRIKLLCIPLNAKNSKTELIALTKLEVWWHLIIKLNKDIIKFVTPVITQFLNYCFGPLGDTPLLSSKFDVVASPVKRFFGTKVVAVDALCQLLVTKEVCPPMLEERLPHAISYEVFQECSKNVIHSIAEALLILSQLTDKEMKNRFQLGKTLWKSLIIYIRNVQLETKDHLYRDVILVVTELINHIDKLMVRDMIFNVILPDINCILEKTEFHDNSLPELVLKLLTSPILDEVLKYILNYDSNTIKCLLERCVGPEFTYSSGVFGFLETIMANLKLLYDARQNKDSNELVYIELWSMIAEILTKYIRNTEINGNDNFKVMKSILSFPFNIHMKDNELIKDQARVWKTIYKEIELHSDSITTMKANEILFDTASMMQNCLSTNKNCHTFIVNCLDTLLSTLDYESLSAEDEIPSILQLIIDTVTISFKDLQIPNCEIALKALSSLLVSVYGHNLQKIVSYLHKCKSVIKLVLSSHIAELHKEVGNTWECVISIFKGLNKQLNHELLSSYKEVIAIAMRHVNPNIKIMTRFIFEVKDSLDSTAKCILDELEQELKPLLIVYEQVDCAKLTTKKTEQTKKPREIRILNRKCYKDAKSVPHKSSEKKAKSTIPPEPDSQDYVYIKTDLKFDVNRLTEHQKETLKKKREDIPALYNDLSQSSSQNSQNLQQWFDIKAKHINETDKISNKKSDSTMQKSINNDANKENKVKQIEFSNATDKIVDDIRNNELDGNIGENNKQNESSPKKDESDERQETSNQTNLSPRVASFNDKNITSTTNEEADATTKESVAKKLNFESRDEFPEDKMHERQSSPSVLENSKRRHRGSMTRLTSSLKDDETIEIHKDPNNSINVQKTLRVKTTQGKSDTDDDTDIKEDSNEDKKGIKRKYVSDSESDEGVQHRKRKFITSKNLNDDGETSQSDSNFSDIDKRMRNEISRLKIDMNFDRSVVNRRRIKHSDEGEKEITHGLRKYGTPDYKNFKFKFVDTKSTEGSKRSPKAQEKDKSAKDVDNTEQGIFKKRGRPRSKQDSNKSDLDANKDATEDVNKDINKDRDKKFNDSIDKAELKNADTVMIYIPTSNQVVQEISKPQDERLDKSNLKSNSDVKLAEFTKSSEQSQDEVEDIVESSQIPNVDSKLDKIYNEKRCFIKINKMTNVHVVKTSDAIADKKYVPESIPMDCDDNNVPDPCEKLDEANSDSTEIKNKENVDSIDKDSVQKTDNSNLKSLISEDPKTVDDSSSIKSTNVTSFSSPRSNSKIFSKPKPFTGRAAHMLGLVTNQIIVDNPPIIILETESSKTLDDLKKSKKDLENETSKQTIMVKEIDKIGGPCSSRQEKIFNNMKSTDYSASSSTHTFTTLKNDGEKLSFKVNRSASDCLATESSIDKENERNASPSCERDDLPILEWSSANPPSLTASPSASILKRHRSSLPELDLDITPKRKRVSFADPPVSKEMGYEISTAESPSQKAIKYSTPRNSTPRKDSSIRFKQTKLKLDTEKLLIPDEGNVQSENGNDVAAESEKKNESLTKISEAYSEDIDMNEQISSDSLKSSNSENIVDANSCVRIVIDKLQLTEETEITTDSVVPEVRQSSFSEDSNDTLPIDVETEDSETQQDIFDEMDTRNNITVIQTRNKAMIQNNSVDSIKLNVSDDSVIAALPTKDDDPTNMEDTVDIQNVTGLNSIVNTDEIFCEKPVRSSTHATETIAEQDTVSITDSVFSSLSTQDTQNQATPNNAKLDPEFLDSTQSIYPTLLSCVEPISNIIEHLTYPLWKHSLSMYLVNRNVHTIGDFAQQSEREVNRMPVKGHPKTEFVKKVLENFESTYSLQAKPSDKESNEAGQLPTKATDETPIAPIAAISDIETGSATIDNKTLTCSTPLIRPTDNTSNNLPRRNSPIEDADKTVSLTSDMDISLEPMVPDNPDLLDTFEKDEQTNAKITVELSKPETDNAEPVPIPSTSSESIVTTSHVASSSNNLDAKDPIKFSLLCDELLITHSSVGTNTNEINFTTPTVQKSTKSVASQMTLAELLDEIDVKLVMESATRRCSPETILQQYKIKMAHLKEGELLKKTIRMLGLQNNQHVNDASLKAACRACGINKVLLRLPDIFSHDKQFFDKVLKLYSKKLNIADGLKSLDFNKLKDIICQKCTSSEIVEILSQKLKQEEQEGIEQSMPELSSLNSLLKRLPTDVIISHTVANEELIPASVVLDIALQNNSSGDIAQALKQSPVMARRVLNKLWTSQLTVTHIENDDVSKESLRNIFKSICSKLTAQELLDTYHEAMTSKLNEEKKNIENEKR